MTVKFRWLNMLVTSQRIWRLWFSPYVLTFLTTAMFVLLVPPVRCVFAPRDPRTPELVGNAMKRAFGLGSCPVLGSTTENCGKTPFGFNVTRCENSIG